jgi:hypothetical protein
MVAPVGKLRSCQLFRRDCRGFSWCRVADRHRTLDQQRRRRPDDRAGRGGQTRPAASSGVRPRLSHSSGKVKLSPSRSEVHAVTCVGGGCADGFGVRPSGTQAVSYTYAPYRETTLTRGWEASINLLRYTGAFADPNTNFAKLGHGSVATLGIGDVALLAGIAIATGAPGITYDVACQFTTCE